MSDLSKKVADSIKILRMYRGDDPIEVSYSGGKDSDVILSLVRESGIPYRAIYKNTTIDPPYTVKHCKDNGVEVLNPKISFFDVIRKKGYPTRRARFCCEELKEYKVLNNAVQGIRRCESTGRAKRYKEPIICRMYKKKEHCNIFLPILEWSDKDVSDYIKAHGIQCHPLYYPNGFFDVTQRLGCIGCPMASDNGLSGFRTYPKMVKLWTKAAGQLWESRRDNPLLSMKKFSDVYALFAHNVFFDDYDHFSAAQNSMFGKVDWRQHLQDFFKIEL